MLFGFKFYHLIFLVLKLCSTESLKWNHSHEKYDTLLNSLIDVNEERMKTINRMIRLNDFNYNGLLRTLLHEKPQENYAVFIVNNKDLKTSQEKPIKSSLRTLGTSSEEIPIPSPKIYGPDDNMPVKVARRRCFYACQNAYRTVCREFKYDCTKEMRKYFRYECREACDKRF